MSARSINVKKAKRVRKALRRTLPRNFDLVQYLIDHKHAATKRSARQMLVDGKVKSDSHVLGRVEVPLMKDGKVVMGFAPQPITPISARENLTVLA